MEVGKVFVNGIEMEMEKVDYDTYYSIAKFQSSYRGFIHARYEDLVAVFGEPRECDDGKVQVEWLLLFYNPETDRYIPASIYDWKMGSMYWRAEGLRGVTPDRITSWHIGGTSSDSVDCVHDAFKSLVRKAA